MKLNPITQNQTNFKAFYKPEIYNFTENQEFIIKDIKKKLGDRVLEKDYCVKPYGWLGVSLHQVEGFKVNPYNPDDLIFEKEKYSMVCYDDCPLDIDKLDAKEKCLGNEEKGCLFSLRSLLATFIAATAIISAGYIAKNNKSLINSSPEFVNKIDTLKNTLQKDTLDLTKNILK